jgi:macrolide-specific efflux system membrane fusion protein
VKKLWIGIIVVIVLAVGFFFFRKRITAKSSQPQSTVVEVKRGDIEVKVLSTGTIQPYTRVEVRSPVNGRIDKIEADEGDIVKNGDILAWISSEDRIALIDAARSALESAQKSNDEATIKEAKTAYEIAEKAYKPVPLTNSISGEVINRSGEPGQNVTTQTVLFVISDRLVASVQVDEADIGKITVGLEAKIVLDAFPDEPVQAKVTKISREAIVVSDVVVYEVMVEPLKVPARWASGMTANVEFYVVRKPNVLVLPKGVIRERDGRKIALVLSSDQAEPRKVETGATDGKMIEVVSGLQEGDKVILTNNQNQPNQRDNTGRNMRRMMRSFR